MKMLVNSTHDLGKAWVAHNTGEYPRDQREKGNVRYHAGILYSRSTPVARFHTMPGTAGRKYVLAQSKSYSPSTSRQIGRCTSPCHHAGVPVFHVPNIGAQGGWSNEPGLSTPELHAANFAHMLAEYKEWIEKIVRRWQSNSGYTWGIDHLNRLHHHMVHYATVTGTSSVTLLPLDQTTADIYRRMAARFTAYNDPKAVAKRERAYARKMALKAFELDAIAA